jgi:hypothetical protein
VPRGRGARRARGRAAAARRIHAPRPRPGRSNISVAGTCAEMSAGHVRLRLKRTACLRRSARGTRSANNEDEPPAGLLCLTAARPNAQVVGVIIILLVFERSEWCTYCHMSVVVYVYSSISICPCSKALV